jgi:heme A synthase
MKQRAEGKPEAPMHVPFNHLQAMLLFALIISLAFGTLGRRKPTERLKYAAWSFCLFILVGVAIGWLMFPFSR